ncbi:hypothetical protein [Chryseobacterium pennipullorum]|uniref:DUF4149 domain-containing protein n=1 Tax=Chryseobacterium pennipullorum TaxID=2258963 RepID=A0A3D9B1L1_9FLAO|nr:hypothetical protein [Chryseobacterium pennipullorum]REC47473.1 hypothetical protein DRF67_10545 [Chryseobacterium pennipullorum]
MKFYLKNPLVLTAFCLMTGVFITISFIETPLKFQVEGITLPIALGLGKLMFGVSTALQWFFLVLILGLMLISRKNYTKSDFYIMTFLFLLQASEQFWMLPVLDARVDALSSGKTLAPTALHDYFINTEIAKAILMITAIALQFKKNKKYSL